MTVVTTVLVTPTIVLFLGVTDEGTAQAADGSTDQGPFAGVAGLVPDDRSGAGTKTGSDGCPFLRRCAGGEGE